MRTIFKIFTILFCISFLLFACKKDRDALIDPNGSLIHSDSSIIHLNTNWIFVNNFTTNNIPQNITSIAKDNHNNIWASYVWDSSYIVDSIYVMPKPGGNWYWQYKYTTI
jgi:hypothetical protein